jgi:hypothetical protein
MAHSGSAGAAGEQPTAGESSSAGSSQAGGTAQLGGSGGTGGTTPNSSGDGGYGGDAGYSGGGHSGYAGHGGHAGYAGSAGNHCGAAGSGGRSTPPNALLRLTTDPVETAECPTMRPTPPPGWESDFANECGCDELTCPETETCIRVLQPAKSALGGQDIPRNGCFALCDGSDDCEAAEHCVRNLYGLKVCAPACRSDADCDACTPCNQGYLVGHAGAVYADDSQSRCAGGP